MLVSCCFVFHFFIVGLIRYGCLQAVVLQLLPEIRLQERLRLPLSTTSFVESQ